MHCAHRAGSCSASVYWSCVSLGDGLSALQLATGQQQEQQHSLRHPVSGRILLPEGTTPTSRVRLILTLDGGDQQLAWARPDASFRFHEVPPGSHLLDVVAMGLVFPQVRLDIEKSGQVTASLVEHPLTLMQAPLLLRPVSRAEYFEIRQPFNPKAFLMSPMGLAMAFGVFSLVVLPMLKVDPEEAKDLFGAKDGEAESKQVQQPERPQIASKQSRGHKKHN
ncbi:hypothetical protein WJX84_000760 [Apatococcus fuscideae]|uniref:ER membrane protein complex subunit 7 beta-sandwich domain-containing protein n=1 Tax=Apatococcus fuscideae TaxID=2026836 RepID=A0AAW1SNA5_9CHLO